MNKLKKVFSKNHKPAATRKFNRLADSFKQRNNTGIVGDNITPEFPKLHLRYMVDDYDELFRKDDTGKQ